MQYRGTVIEGKHKGATLGFPTANIVLEDTSLSGIYAATATVDGVEFLAAVYADQERGLLETHLLDYGGEELYGIEITIEMREKIRDDMRFDSMEELRDAIKADITKIRDYFAIVQ